MRSFVHASMRLCVHAFMRPCVYAFMRLCIHAFMRLCVNVFRRLCVYAFMHPCVYAFMRLCVHAFMRWCVYAFTAGVRLNVNVIFLLRNYGLLMLINKWRDNLFLIQSCNTILWHNVVMEEIRTQLGGVNHCRLHCRLAKSRGLMRRGKYGTVIGQKTRFFVCA